MVSLQTAPLAHAVLLWRTETYTRDPLQRHLRDVLAMAQHFSFNFDIAGSAYGLQVLDGAYANPTM